MLIGGFQKESLIDYPGKICAIIFTVGCNFRCSYCHNSELVIPEKIKNIGLYSEEQIFNYLKKRIGIIDALEITGGEPTLQKDLDTFMKKVKSLGLLIKLDTNGTNPEVIKRLINEKLVDYIAMDVKAPLKRYDEITRVSVDIKKIEESIRIIINSDLDYEFRTTAIPYLKEEDFIEIGKLIQGAKNYYIQQFSNKDTLENLNIEPYPEKKLEIFKNLVKPFVKNVEIRNE